MILILSVKKKIKTKIFLIPDSRDCKSEPRLLTISYKMHRKLIYTILYPSIHPLSATYLWVRSLWQKVKDGIPDVPALPAPHGESWGVPGQMGCIISVPRGVPAAGCAWKTSSGRCPGGSLSDAWTESTVSFQCKREPFLLCYMHCDTWSAWAFPLRFFVM